MAKTKDTQETAADTATASADVNTQDKAASPAISAAEAATQRDALLAQLAALDALASPDVSEPGSQVRPTTGMVHPVTRLPIFNVNRPTGKGG